MDGGPTHEQMDKEKRATLRKRISKIESLTCSACRALEAKGFDFDLNPALSEWWDKHKQDDAQREKERDAARLRKEHAALIAQKPFGELTAAEKRILKAEGYFN